MYTMTAPWFVRKCQWGASRTVTGANYTTDAGNTCCTNQDITSVVRASPETPRHGREGPSHRLPWFQRDRSTASCEGRHCRTCGRRSLAILGLVGDFQPQIFAPGAAGRSPRTSSKPQYLIYESWHHGR